jgi:phosphohistidine phosphatase
MRLLFLRHGIAEDVSPDGTDYSRRLTAEGIESMQTEAAGMARLNLKVELILASPLVRAAQTADIVALALGLRSRLREEMRLGLGFSLHHLKTIVGAYSDTRTLMLVGHEPGMSTVVGQLIGGADVEMKKGSLAIVDALEAEAGAGCLVMLAPPALLRRAGGDP